ncbi:MAG: O-methyltransferase [Halobacteriaceae archaeon]
MGEVLSDDAASVLAHAAAPPDPVLAEMAAHGREESFPVVGPHAGRALRLLARTAGARRVFEFGSGFGYSAAWFLGALPDDGELVLTDHDPARLDTAREFLGRYDSPVTVRYEAGDAIETFAETVGGTEKPVDVALFDHEKSRYVEALDAVLGTLEPGSLVVADNVLAGPVTPGAVRDALAGDEPADETVAGVARYLECVRDDPALETSVLPLGEGLAVSRYEP